MDEVINMAVNPMLLEYLKRQGYEVPEKREYAYEGANRDQMISGLSKLSSAAGSLGGKQADYLEPQDFSAQQAERAKFAQANQSDRLQEYLMKKLNEEKKPTEWRESSKLSPTGKRVYYDPITLQEREGLGAKNEPPASQTPQATEEGLRKEFGALPEVKNFKITEDNYRAILNIAPTAAGDMSLIFSYMKMLDPGSTVREGEFANAQNAAGIPDRLRNTYNQIISGERLNPDQRLDFKKQAGTLYQQRKQLYEQAAGQYEGLTKQYGADPSRVIMPRQAIEPQAETKEIGGVKYKKVQGGWQKVN